MAVTSIWRVNGWLGKVVLYVENPDKTTNPEFYGKSSEQGSADLEDVIADVCEGSEHRCGKNAAGEQGSSTQ